MQPQYAKTAVIGGWALGVGVVAVSLGLDSAAGWTLLAAVGLVPPLMLLRMWRQPAPTMSESIRDVLK